MSKEDTTMSDTEDAIVEGATGTKFPTKCYFDTKYFVNWLKISFHHIRTAVGVQRFGNSK